MRIENRRLAPPNRRRRRESSPKATPPKESAVKCQYRTISTATGSCDSSSTLQNLTRDLDLLFMASCAGDWGWWTLASATGASSSPATATERGTRLESCRACNLRLGKGRALLSYSCPTAVGTDHGCCSPVQNHLYASCLLSGVNSLRQRALSRTEQLTKELRVMSRAVMSLSVHHTHVQGGAAASVNSRFKILPRTPCWSSWEFSFNPSSPEPCLRSTGSRLLHRRGPAICRAVGNQDGSLISNDGDGDDDGRPSSKDGMNESVSSNFVRDNLEKMLGNDDLNFTGMDLATLIRKKYGRSYDVQLIKKEFMGRNLLAMNVMWKYMEQRSFPLTEEEYLLRLDDVANTLKCWGAVSHVRNSLARMKERPRIGKAVSIFIDMDESGGRSNEWIYK